MTLEALPMLRPFEQAVAFQLERTPMTAAEFAGIEGAAKMRGFYIGGLTRDALVKEAHRAATRAIAEGLTHDEFLGELGDVLDKQDGLLLSPQRLELIARNNFSTSYAAGRYAQMSDPDVTATRPFWQYPLGPSDTRTTAICKKLEGFLARHDDPAWEHVYPPNHHGERHLQVLTLTEDQARELGTIYESPEGLAYPHIDGQTILPNPGWDFRPDLLGADDRELAAGADFIADAAAIGAKRPSDYGLAAFVDIAAADLPALPAEADDSWDAFREVFGMAAGQEETWYATPAGSVRISRALFEGMPDAGRLGSVLKATLDDPFEVWIVDSGERLEMRMLGLFWTGHQRAVLTVAKAENGWIFATDPFEDLEAKRLGWLVSSKAGRTS